MGAEALFCALPEEPGHTCHRRLGLGYLHSCAVGLSGVVFGLIVADTAVSRASHRSIFGFFQVSSQQNPITWQ